MDLHLIAVPLPDENPESWFLLGVGGAHAVYAYRGGNAALLGQVLRVPYKCLAAEADPGFAPGVDLPTLLATGQGERDTSSLLRCQVDALFVAAVSRRRLRPSHVPAPKIVCLRLGAAAAMQQAYGTRGRGYELSLAQPSMKDRRVFGCLYPDCTSGLILGRGANAAGGQGRQRSLHDVDETRRRRVQGESQRERETGEGVPRVAPRLPTASSPRRAPDGALVRGVSQPPAVVAERPSSDVWMVELKPKRPTPTVTPLARSLGFALGPRLSRLLELLSPFRRKQLFKAWKRRKARGAEDGPTLSAYDPRLLYSDQPEDLAEALAQLRRTPQANLIVRRNGRALSMEEIRGSSHPPRLFDAVAQILAHEGVLRDVADAVKTLDRIGYVGAMFLSQRLLSGVAACPMNVEVPDSPDGGAGGESALEAKTLARLTAPQHPPSLFDAISAGAVRAAATQATSSSEPGEAPAKQAAAASGEAAASGKAPGKRPYAGSDVNPRPTNPGAPSSPRDAWADLPASVALCERCTACRSAGQALIDALWTSWTGEGTVDAGRPKTVLQPRQTESAGDNGISGESAASGASLRARATNAEMASKLRQLLGLDIAVGVQDTGALLFDHLPMHGDPETHRMGREDPACTCRPAQEANFAAALAWVEALDLDSCAQILVEWNEAAAFADCSVLVTMRAEPGEAQEEGVARTQTEQEPGFVHLREASFAYRVTVVDIAAKLSSRICKRPILGVQEIADAAQELDMLVERSVGHKG